jgi:streptogramin lyase
MIQQGSDGGSDNQLIKLPDERIVPSAIAVDSNDNLWITSPNTNEILKFDSKQEISLHLSHLRKMLNR